MREVVTITDYLNASSTTAAIQAAIDHLSSVGGGTLYFPRGTYVLDPTTYVPGYSGEADPQFGPLYAAVTMRSQISFVGDLATIKLKDNASTDADPRNLCLFHSSESLRDIGFSGIAFDLNGMNNQISPNRAGGTTGDYSRRHHAAIMFTGTFGKADGMRIDRCIFLDSAGISCIVAGLIVPASGLGKRWQITDCNFLNNGLDTYDHSSVYLWAEDSLVARCRFDNDVIYAPSAGVLTGLNAACELHGSNSVFESNYVRHANRGMFMATNGTVAADNLTVRNNTFSGCKFSCVDLHCAGAPGDPQPANWVVENNIALMSSDDTNVDNGQVVAGISMVAGGTVKSLVIRGNRLSRPASPSGRSSAFVVLGLIAAGTDEVVIENNVATGVTIGVYAYGATAALSTAKSIVIRDNVWTDLAGGALPVYPRSGVYFFMNVGRFDRVEVSGNSTVDTRAVLGTTASVFLKGNAGSKITELRVSNDKVDRRVPLVDRVQVDVVTLDRADGYRPAHRP